LNRRCGLKTALAPKNLAVRLEADPRAAAVVDLAEVFQLALGMAALERHAIELLTARDLDLEPRGQRVDHGDADAVQAAGGLVNLESNLPPECSVHMMTSSADFFGNFGCGSTGIAAAIVG